MERDSYGAAGPEQGGPEQGGPESATPGPAQTGDARVDQALARLADLSGLPVDGHPAIFEHVHRGLTAAFGTLDSGAEEIPGTPGTSGTRGTPDTPITPES
jgi:hypothetical protein